jgi:hypothetical protein
VPAQGSDLAAATLPSVMASATTLATARLVLSCNLCNSCLTYCGSRFVVLNVGFFAVNRFKVVTGPCFRLLSRASGHTLYHRERYFAD